MRIKFSFLRKKREKNICVFFFPKISNCSVAKLVILLEKGKILPFLRNKKAVFIHREKYSGGLFGKKYSNLVIFGHSKIGEINLSAPFQQTHAIDWGEINGFLYVHACYGSILLRQKKLINWISYKTHIPILFHNPDTDERLRIFFENIIAMINLNAPKEFPKSKLDLIYINELMFLEKEKGKGKVGFEFLKILLHQAFEQLETS
jgi:hypothetical protein